MKKEEIKFTVDQLRKDKIIYAVEATATALTCILGFWFSSVYAVLFVCVGYTLYMDIGNFFRLKK